MCNLAEGIEEEALAIGRAEGRAEERLDAIKRMISKNYSEESILDLGFTKEEINKAKE